MIVLKKQINLGLLIILTLVGSFYCLFAGYNCITCVAMFQIITLVKSNKYRQLYGEDPFDPIPLRRSHGSNNGVQQLRMLGTPEDTDIDEQKRLAKLGLWPPRQPQIISVIPMQTPAVNLKWWQLQAMDKDDKLQDSAVYRNWQRDELLRGVGGDAERKNAINRRYADLQLYQWH
ncbi:GH10696 [Drosophila grimshawi]|uniref:GH10696 n=2 Tax=Drosophila grimshawi TaxID=7222 RepID=B4JC60_DROGR|nr:GH10696 [Drosophila grimshawi]